MKKTINIDWKIKFLIAFFNIFKKEKIKVNIFNGLSIKYEYFQLGEKSYSPKSISDFINILKSFNRERLLLKRINSTNDPISCKLDQYLIGECIDHEPIPDYSIFDKKSPKFLYGLLGEL